MNSRTRRASAAWPLLTDHARVLLWLAVEPEIRCRDLAERSGICERHAQTVISQLVQHGYVTRSRRGRGNRYEVDPHAPLRLPVGGPRTVADLLEALGHPRPDGPSGRPAPLEEPMNLLTGKRLLITGVVTTDSIAYLVAQRSLAEGAEVVLTSFDRDYDRTVEAASELPAPVEVLELDVTDETHFDRLGTELAERWDHLDGALHAVAFAPRSALAGDFLDADLESVQRAFATSTYSYAALSRLLARSAPDTGGAIVGLDFDAARAWPVYNWMGVCKSALESVNRYVARDLGQRRIRSNLVAAGPLHTRAAGGIPEFERLTDAWEARSPMAWDPKDAAPVADAVCFLLSDLGRGVTGEIVHVDGGFHAMAADLRPGPDRG